MSGRDDPVADCNEALPIGRRALLVGGAASLALWSLRPPPAFGAGRDPRLLTIILRGGLDGLSIVAPVGDPEYQRLRGPLAVPSQGIGAGIALDSFFALNASMPFLADLYRRRQALAVHGVATPYRGRSHFDGQDVLESGLGGVGRIEDGWLNRALGGLAQPRDERSAKGLAMGAVVPLVMRGAAPVLSWIPDTSGLPLRQSTIDRLADLYAHSDERLAKAFAEGIAIGKVGKSNGVAVAGSVRPALADQGKDAIAKAAPSGAGAGAEPKNRPFREFVETAKAAAQFLAASDGPRVGALSFNGWDTHANEGVTNGLLSNRLAGLDLAIRTLHDGLGTAWGETAIVIVTEFGRTARPNGTGGTDHGTATAALVLGGAVKGGRVIADWPGLSDAALFEGRDLKPTMDLRGVLKGVLQDHLGIPSGALAARVFPDSSRIVPVGGLIA